MQASDRELLIATMENASALAMALAAKTITTSYKGDGTPVTNIDRAVDDLLRTTLMAARPGDAWLSEETPDDAARLDQSRLWIADPIDGTRNLAKGNDKWAIGVALVDKGEVVLSCLAQPSLNRFYVAEKNHGAFLNDVRLQISDANPAVMAKGPVGDRLSKHNVILSDTQGLPSLLRLAEVAQGTLSGSVEAGDKNDWDLAAGVLLVTEAGGLVSLLNGAALVFNAPKPSQNGIIAATPKIHSQLVKFLEQP